MNGPGSPALLLDEHVPVALAHALRDRALDVRHALEEGLGGTPDPALLRWCQARGRVLVTRNYGDFAPLAEMLGRRGEDFPGVLFFSSSVPQADVGAHLRAVEVWLEGLKRGRGRVSGTFGWLG